MAVELLDEVPDGRGRTVSLLAPCWKHAMDGHPEMADAEEAIKLTIRDPAGWSRRI
jgi:hypothetical protein